MGFLLESFKNKTAVEKLNMKTNLLNKKSRGARSAFYENFSLAASPARVSQASEFETLKKRLLRRLLDDAVQPELNLPLRGAVDDAASLAWETGYPLLFLPSLVDEKARNARLQFQKQSLIRSRSEAIVMEVA